MKKQMAITPEWVLEKLPTAYHLDGNGNVTIATDSISDSHWIDLALKTIGVTYETDFIGYDPDPEMQFFEILWEFKLDDIKEECPKLHEQWKILDDTNSCRMKALN